MHYFWHVKSRIHSIEVCAACSVEYKSVLWFLTQSTQSAKIIKAHHAFFLRIDRAHYTAGNGPTLPKGPSNLHSHFRTIHNTIMCRVTLAENHYFITPDCSWQVHCLYWWSGTWEQDSTGVEGTRGLGKSGNLAASFSFVLGHGWGWHRLWGLENYNVWIFLDSWH